MARNTLLLRSRNKKLLNRYRFYVNKKDKGVQEKTFEWIFQTLSEEFHLAPRTIEDIVKSELRSSVEIIHS
jgi:hypothetical protein